MKREDHSEKARRDQAPDLENLRGQAEDALRNNGGATDVREKSMQEMVHELQVQQVELEMQNEELRTAQVELAVSRDRYADLYEFAPVGYLTIDTQGVILEANLTVASMFGVERGLLLARRNLQEFIHRDDRDVWFLHSRGLFDEIEKQTHEFKMNRVDGTNFIARLESNLLERELGMSTQCMVAVIDITEQKRAEELLLETKADLERRVQERTQKLVGALVELQMERTQLEKTKEALRASEVKYRTLAENTIDILYAIDTNGLLAFVGPQVRRYGFTPQQMIGKPFTDFVAPEDRKRVLREFAESAASRDSTRSEFRVLGADGLVYWLEENSTVQRGVGQAITGIMGVLRDVTHRRAMEEHQSAQQERLRRLAAKLASAQDREQRRIAEGLHDDVAQVLVACNVRLGRIHSCESVEEAAAVAEECDKILRSALEKTRALTFELISSTLLRLGIEEALGELCDDMSSRYDVEFEFRKDKRPKPMSQETAIVLFKATRELLFNVVKHAHVKQAKISITRVQNDIQISVEDRGKGFKVGSADGETGDGLGLLSVRERIADLGGNLDIKSTPGVYTGVTIRAPLEKKNDNTAE